MSYTQQLYEKNLARSRNVDLAALAVGYKLSWAADMSLCWLEEPYDGRANTDDAWAPDRLLSDATSLAMALRLTVAVSNHAVHVSHHMIHVLRATEPASTVEERNAAYMKAVFYVATKMGQYKHILPTPDGL